MVIIPWQLRKILTVLESYRESLVLGNELGFVCFGLSRENVGRISNAVFRIFSNSFNTITFKMLALKVDDVGKGLRTGPESK